jgi:hypothetical protein
LTIDTHNARLAGGVGFSSFGFGFFIDDKREYPSPGTPLP